MLSITFERFSQISKKYSKIARYLYENVSADEETAFFVKLAVYELAGNILKHSKAKANLFLKCEGDLIKIIFTGSKAFDVGNISLPPCDCESGRGIYLVKNLSESMEYYNGGRDVCVCIRSKSNLLKQ